MFGAWKARRAAARERERLDDLAQQRAAIETELALAQQRLDAARGIDDATGSALPDGVGIILKKGESVLCVVTGAVLVEPRKGPGQWKGRSQGVSVPIPGTSLRYRVGASKGHFEMGEERPTPIDTGTFVITSARGVFVGQKQSREWVWSKLLGVTHYDPGWTAMAVSGRQKVSGVGVDSANREALDFWIDLAVARANGTTAQLEDDCRSDVEQLTDALARLDASSAPSTPEPPPLPPPPV